MTLFLKLVSSLVDMFHLVLGEIIKRIYPNADDKFMHLIVIGFIGIIIFFVANIIFKWLSKYSIEIISFIFSLFVVLVLVFAIEIQQYVTGNGRMEFKVFYMAWLGLCML
ncbi:MAG: hypothetical protein MJA31_18525 [Clostridia bacterium]|nr:hypothetical protein [Clostridia bacterium]